MTDDYRLLDWAEAVRALPRGAAVIVRAREAAQREALARTVMPIAHRAGVLVLIASDAALALKMRADGVHIPEKGAARAKGFRRLYPNLLLTMSAHGAPGLVAARRIGADASILSPMFPTTSHPGSAGLGRVRWGLLRRQTPLAIFALGGIDMRSAPAAMALGANGLAVIGAWTANASAQADAKPIR